MRDGHFSLILLPTLMCNADCSYCFEQKSSHHLDHQELAHIIRKVMDYLAENHIGELSIYWQGGEVLTLPPEWFERAHDVIEEIALAKRCRVSHFLQSNLIAYNSRWNRIIREMFDNSVGSSMDFPNLHRRIKDSTAEAYTGIWRCKVQEAMDAGIEVGVITIPNEKTLEMGAERFYSHFVEELGIRDFQINTPFPGGAANAVKRAYPLDCGPLGRFLTELAEIWLARDVGGSVRIGPFDRLLDYFRGGDESLLCIWQDNCVNEFVCIDPRGHVAQCDCWVTSYPDFRFGNIFDSECLADLLLTSEARRRLQSRPTQLIRQEDCLECDYLALCHGGCPVRTYTITGTLLQRDPYCSLYQTLFRTAEKLVNG